MCGIAAVIGNVREGDWQETHNLMSTLLIESMERGIDATGFAAVTSSLDRPHNHKLLTAKAPQPADEFVSTNPFWATLKRMRSCSVIAHVRAATSGSPSRNSNNHPFVGRMAKRGSFSLVHNGVLSQPKETADRLSLKLNTDCDSELAEKLVSATGDYALGLHRCLTELKGSMALVLVEHNSGVIWAVRDGGRPLWIAKLRDGRRTILCSTPQIITRAVEQTLGAFHSNVASLFPMASGYVHAFMPDGRIIAPYVPSARLEAG
jgi:glucosamine 6-phosphate synthetase-like amidotransferase/phosphosugar isomerase protein